VEYPNLSKMARDYLAIPCVFTLNCTTFLPYNYINILTILATSASVERIFSGGTDLVVQRRCSLHGETIQQFMCLRDWWKSGLGE
jgi:hypothetical protein